MRWLPTFRALWKDQAHRATLEYMVLFDATRHHEADFRPPKDVQGGIMGEVPDGLLGAYWVPETQERAFLAAIKACKTVVRRERLMNFGAEV